MNIDKEILKQQIELCSSMVDMLNILNENKADLMEGVTKILEELLEEKEQRIKMLITVEGGINQDISIDSDHQIDVLVLDLDCYDNMSCHIKSPSGNIIDCELAYNVCSHDKKLVDHYFNQYEELHNENR